MSQRLDDLLLRLRERFTPDADVADVEAYLAAEGFTRGQIGEILSLLSAPPAAAPPPGAGLRTGAFRVQGPHERGRFTPEAWGHLLSLTGTGIITAGELEHVIERALTHIDGRIALDDLRSLMEGSGLDESGSATDHAVVH